MRQMPVTPEPLRESQEQTEIAGEDCVGTTRTKEGRMDEVMRNRVGIPPQAEPDQPRGWRDQEKQAMDQCQTDEQTVPGRMTQEPGLVCLPVGGNAARNRCSERVLPFPVHR